MSSGTRLFVSNLPDNISENDLRSAFSSYGEITNLDIKSKSATSEDQKKFAFITLSASNYDVESCIKYFSNSDFKGNKLYVTRARESFLERLQREREQTQKKETEKKDESESLPKSNPVIKLSDKLNPRKRKIDSWQPNNKTQFDNDLTVNKIYERPKHVSTQPVEQPKVVEDPKKTVSDKKRMDSMLKKRQEFKQKQMIIKSGLTGVDKVQNKKIVFSDGEDDSVNNVNGHTVKPTNVQNKKNNNTLFDEEDSEDEVNFEIKEQFEGKAGQKVLELQSRFKSDKRFTLDERFIEDNEADNTQEGNENEEVELQQTDEKAKQLNILQNVLGVAIKARPTEQDGKKAKNKIGMLRFDPSQPDHAKFLLPIEEKQETQKKSKKKSKDKKEENVIDKPIPVETVEVSKEQFYKVSETLKEAIAQPTSFSLRSLFSKTDNVDTETQEQDASYIPIESKKPKMKNPLDPGEKNPFVYDSSDSETEEVDNTVTTNPIAVAVENKAVWKENLFFSKLDSRLKEGLAFFNEAVNADASKERRELKSVMKKRIYNNERKNQMFQKKIGGRKKTMKKNFRKK